MTATGQRGQVPAGGGAARVVVAGAGFGGLAAVRGLARAGMRTTLIDRNVYMRPSSRCCMRWRPAG